MKEAGIPKELNEKSLDEIRASDFLLALERDYSSIQSLIIWRDKKKYEKWVEPENLGDIKFGDFWRKLKDIKKTLEYEVFPILKGYPLFRGDDMSGLFRGDDMSGRFGGVTTEGYTPNPFGPIPWPFPWNFPRWPIPIPLPDKKKVELEVGHLLNIDQFKDKTYNDIIQDLAREINKQQM